jgi:outer membrane immunogenic protein
MRVLIAAALTTLAAAGAAQAQDAQTDPWTGAYVGAHAGGSWLKDKNDESILFDTNLDGTFNNTVTTAAGANAFSPGFCNGAANGSTPAAGCSEDENGFEFGVRAGYDRQFGSFVLGGLVEGTRADVQDAVSAFSTTPASYTMDRKLRELGAVRLRGGLAWGETLFYGTGGFATARVHQTFATTNTANSFALDKKKWASGYQFGGGMEHKIRSDLSLGVEYLYTKLNDDDFTVRAGGPVPATNPFVLANASGTDFPRGQEDIKTHSLRAVLNYRF